MKTALRSIRALSKRRHRGGRGGVLIEAAFALIILVIMTGGMIEFGWLIFVMHTSTGAARSGARVAIVAGAVKSDVDTAVSNIMTATGWTTSQYTVEINDQTADPTTIVDPSTIPVGHDVAVHVKSTWANLGVSVFNFVSSTRAINCVVVMRKES